ncbi:MAG: sugar phosphate isomerase/epimerase [Armatimonadetes bacterium]|nr:sugar phosphate isomerase/epimerase [Armatimonadota bacterium]
MKLAYQVATPEVHTPDVTAWRGDLPTAFSLLTDLGYGGVELMVRDPAQVDAPRLEALTREFALPITLVCTGEVYGEDRLSFMDPDPAVRAEARRRTAAAVQLAARFGVDTNVGRLRGRLRDDVPAETSLGWARAALLEAADLAGERGIHVLIEPINHRSANWILTAADGVAFVRDLNHPALALMLDTGHMSIEGEDFAASFLAARGCNRYVHLCDDNRLAPGMGSLDFAAIIAGLRAAGYDGHVAIEAAQRPDSPTAARQSARVLLPLLGPSED